MRDDLLYYYERELTFLRRMGAEFGEKYPKVASRLLLEPSKCEDPHVERLLEGFAFLAARIQLKIDDDFSEVSEALLNIIYPHYIRPIPSMSLVEFELDPDQGKLTSGLPIPRHSVLYSRPVDEVPCRFRTTYDTTLWPVKIDAIEWTTPDRLEALPRAGEALGVLRVTLSCFPDVTFSALELQTLRFYLNGESGLVSTLYELLLNNCSGVVVRDPARPGHQPLILPGTLVQPVGFGPEEGMLPYSRRSFPGYRLLQEYFSFPEKFHFVDLKGLERAQAADFGERVELLFLISPFERQERREMLDTAISADTLRLGCTPVINLFQQASEPIRLSRRTYEYPVVADARRRLSTAVFAVDEVVGVTPGSEEPLRFEPFYSYRHATNGGPSLFWQIKRRPSGWHLEQGDEVFLSFTDLSGKMARPDIDAVTARVSCYNGDLPSRLAFGDPEGDFELQGGGPIRRITALVRPTSVVQPPLGKPLLWRLISQLSLNYMSLVDGGAEGLKELLRLHNFSESPGGEKQVQGILELKSRPCYSRIESEHGLSFARGHRVEIDLDEENFTGGGVYLFASVLERFLGLYVSLNSFCILAARTRQRREILREWPPRAGWKTLL